MQINNINNLEVGGNDNNKSQGLDAALFKDKVITGGSHKAEDVARIGRDDLGVIKASNLTYNHPDNSIMDEIDKVSGADGRISTIDTINQRNFNAIEELGFDTKDLDDKEFVDIADKIRIAMAKGGADISMMGDISDAAIEQSGAYDELNKKALEDAQLPADDKTLDDIKIAMRKVDEIKSQMVSPSQQSDAGGNMSDGNNQDRLSDETIKYMLKGEMEPTIDNLYKASTHSNDMAIETPVDVKGRTDSLEAQFAQVIEEAGLEVNDDNIKDCYYLLNNRIGVTSDSLQELNILRDLTVDDMGNVLSKIVDSLAEGKAAGDAYLAPGFSLMANASAINEGISAATEDTIDELISDNKPLTLSNIASLALDNNVESDVTSTKQEIEAYDNLSKMYELNPAGSETADNEQLTSITYKKQLVQVQLMMSTEANYAMLKRGMAIDTMQLNDYVDAIEELEKQFMETMLGDKASPEIIKNLEDTMDAVNVSKQLPDYAMPVDAMSMSLRSYASISISYEGTTSTIGEDGMTETIESKSMSLQASFSAKFNQARDYYDAAATEVRRDLGDSLNKAFRNVDNLLSELNMELTEENRRAVRILGYNQMEITEQSVKEVKATDLNVARTLNNLTPGVVTEMIKTGINPLDMTMEELLSTSEEIMSSNEATSEEEKFSEFLWRLEQENGITEEEREGFIGVFRLIHQVNETDGAAIGLLLKQNTEVTMRNLLMAVRSARHTNKDYTVDDDFGGIEGFNKDSLNIEQQIEMSLQAASMRNVEQQITPYKMMQFESEEQYMSLTPEQLNNRLTNMETDEAIVAHEEELDDAYSKMRRDEVTGAYRAERQVIEYLKANDMPLTSNNINAITTLMSDRNNISTLLNKYARRQVGLDRDGSYASEVGMETVDDSENLHDEIEDIIANLIHEYGESVKTPDDMAEAEQRLEELAENVMKNMLVEEDVRSIDIRGMHLIQTQIHTQGEISKRSENYTIPIMVADEVGNLNLKIVRGKEEKGLVDIAFNMEKTGTVTASFRYEAGTFIGSVNCDKEATREMLERHEENLLNAIAANTESNATISFNWNRRIDINEAMLAPPNTDFTTVTKQEALEADDETQAVLTTNLYGMARAFIEELGRM